MLLMIDNYDSFTYNLVQYFGELGEDVKVVRNDEIDLAGIASLKPDHIVVSPGPCTPNEAGVSVPLIKEFAGKVPILGVCLGHQSIGQAFGGHIIRAKELMHGKTSMIHHTDAGVFHDLPNPFRATRYHSLVIERAVDTLRTAVFEELIVTGLICLVFLAHVRSALVALVILPIGLLVAILLMTLLGIATGSAPASVEGIGKLFLFEAVGGVLFIAARQLIPRVLEAVIRTRSRELFLMTTLGLCFAIALLTSSVGLSLSLGAFLAGLIMSESEYSHSALEGVLPFRDVFTSVFFVSIGMLLDPAFVVAHLPQVLGLAATVLIMKAALAAVAGRLLGYPWHVAILGGLCLCQHEGVAADVGR